MQSNQQHCQVIKCFLCTSKKRNNGSAKNLKNNKNVKNNKHAQTYPPNVTFRSIYFISFFQTKS